MSDIIRTSSILLSLVATNETSGLTLRLKYLVNRTFQDDKCIDTFYTYRLYINSSLDEIPLCMEKSNAPFSTSQLYNDFNSACETFLCVTL